MQSPVKWLILCLKDLILERNRKDWGEGNRVVPSKDTAGETAMDRRRGRDTLTNEDATYGWRKSFQYVAKRQNGVQEQVRILPDPLVLVLWRWKKSD